MFSLNASNVHPTRARWAADEGQRTPAPARSIRSSSGHLLPDGGVEVKYVLTVTPSSSLNHVDMVEQHNDLDGGSFPVYYRFDRQ